MYHYGLAASHLTQSSSKLSEAAYFEGFGNPPFDGLRTTTRVIVSVLHRVHAFRAGLFRGRRAASVLT